MIEPSIENLKAAVEELKKTGVRELRKENPKQNEKVLGPGTVERPIVPEIRTMPRSARQNSRTRAELGAGLIQHRVAEGGSGAGLDSSLRSELKIAEIELDLSDLIQEKMKLEKILQELNNLKSKICQRIELLKTIERREKELNQQLASVRKENDFSDQIKKNFEDLKENIRPVK